jgi:hypothetical protein
MTGDFPCQVTTLYVEVAEPPLESLDQAIHLTVLSNSLEVEMKLLPSGGDRIRRERH